MPATAPGVVAAIRAVPAAASPLPPPQVVPGYSLPLPALRNFAHLGYPSPAVAAGAPQPFGSYLPYNYGYLPYGDAYARLYAGSSYGPQDLGFGYPGYGFLHPGFGYGYPPQGFSNV